MEESNSKPHKLSIRSIIAQAFIVPWVHRRALFSKLFIPLFFLVLLDIIEWSEPDSESLHITDYAVITVSILLYVYFAVTCHRIIILGTESVPSFGLRKWSMRETRFTAWAVGMMLLIILLFILFSYSPYLLFLTQFEHGDYLIYLLYLFFIPTVIYIISRLGIIFPATAVDEMQTIKWAWAITRGNGWRLVIVFAALPLLSGFVQSILIESTDTNIPSEIIISLLGYIILVIEIALLSLTYKEICNFKPNRDRELLK